MHMSVDPTRTNPLDGYRIQMIPAKPAFTANDHEIRGDQNIKMFHHCGPTKPVDPLDNLAGCQRRIDEGIQDLAAHRIGKRSPDSFVGRCQHVTK